MAQQDKTTLKSYFNTGDTPTEAQFADLIDSAHNRAFTAAMFVSVDGDDANDGTEVNAPKLTIGSAITAASALIAGTATAVKINVFDGGTYTESIVVPENVHIDASAATIIGTVEVSANASCHFDKHFAANNGADMAKHAGGATGAAVYSVNISDGRGIGGALTGANNVSNKGGGGRNFFVRVGILYVGSIGTGIGDVSSGDAGHIHFLVPDLYLAGNDAIGILGASQGAGDSNIIGSSDHILEIGGPTNTTGINMTSADAEVKIVVAEIIADTAYNISAGSLYLSCPKITGTKTGTPANLMIGLADFPTTDPGDGVTIWNDSGVLKVAT